MILNLYERLKQGQELRQTLIQIKELLRGEGGEEQRVRLIEALDGDFGVFAGMLGEEDAKVRKNAALVLGELSAPETMEILWRAYRQEDTRFVRGAYLAALEGFDYSALLPEMQEELEKINKTTITEENRKHLQEEKMALRKLIQAKESRRPHRFRHEGITSDLALMANRNHKHVVMEALGGAKKKEFSAGVMVQAKNPEELFEIRTFEEMFFLMPKCRTVPADPAAAAGMLADGGLVGYLKARHEENGNPFSFRIEIRGTMPLEKRSSFIRRMAAILEEKTKGDMVNAVSGYEVELRLLENKDGEYNLLLKLFTLKDYRFAYRRRALSVGIRPANAALCIALAAGEKRVGKHGEEEGFFREYARVLDPFCGSGTMLIERAEYGKVREMFGLDILPGAIEAARENTGLAGKRANYINRDFFTFTREMLFDEIITDMPFLIKEQEDKRQELEQLYRDFFGKASTHLAEDGTMVLYTHDRKYVRSYAAGKFRILKEFEISMKEGSYLYLMQKIAAAAEN